MTDTKVQFQTKSRSRSRSLPTRGAPRKAKAGKRLKKPGVKSPVNSYLNKAAQTFTHLRFWKDQVVKLISFFRNGKELLRGHLLNRSVDRTTGLPCNKSQASMTSAPSAVAIKSGESGWYELVDTKGDKKLDLKDQQDFDQKLSVIRSAMGGALGRKTLKIHQYLAGTHSATVTTGVVNGTITLDASLFNEWSSLSALFDEYKVTGGNVHWHTNDVAPNPVVASSMYVWAFDPTDGTALTSTAAGCELMQHKLFAVGDGSSVPQAGMATYAKGQPLLFSWVVPEGIMYHGSTADEGMWLPTATPLPFGFLKTYFIGDIATATAVTNWIVKLDVEFRSRQ